MHIWQLKILVVGALGGRFDHEAANIDVLHTFANVLHIVLLSEESSLTLLAPGYLHKIHINCSFEGPHCGLIPLGAPSTSTTTTGLHWNLSKHYTWIFLFLHLQICTSVVKWESTPALSSSSKNIWGWSSNKLWWFVQHMQVTPQWLLDP
jgi:hypothetical protein